MQRSLRPFTRGTGTALVLAVLLALWQAYVWYDEQQLFLPPIQDVFKALLQLVGSGELQGNLAATLGVAGSGYVAGAVIGTGIGLLMATSAGCERFFSPLVRSTYALPKTTLIPLLLIWFGVGGMTNVIIVAVTTLLPFIIYTFQGVREVPAVLRWSALSLNTSRPALVWRVLLPAALPAILIGARIAWGFTLLVAISCEMIVANLGLGRLVFQYGDQGSYDYMFAVLFTITALAYLIDRFLARATAWLLRWHEVSRHEG